MEKNNMESFWWNDVQSNERDKQEITAHEANLTRQIKLNIILLNVWQFGFIMVWLQ